MSEPLEMKQMAGLKAAIEQMESVQRCIAAQKAAEQASADAAQAAESAKFGALVEAATLVSLADKVVSEAEMRALAKGIGEISGLEVGTILGLVTGASERIGGEGQGARATAIAALLVDDELRRGALYVASACAWLGGGVGEKEGLALQALAKAFGIPIPELHKIMGKAHG
jgi:tellurite resistance protein